MTLWLLDCQSIGHERKSNNNRRDANNFQCFEKKSQIDFSANKSRQFGGRKLYCGGLQGLICGRQTGRQANKQELEDSGSWKQASKQVREHHFSSPHFASVHLEKLDLSSYWRNLNSYSSKQSIYIFQFRHSKSRCCCFFELNWIDGISDSRKRKQRFLFPLNIVAVVFKLLLKLVAKPDTDTDTDIWSCVLGLLLTYTICRQK